MDSIAVKLIDRNILIKRVDTMQALIDNLNSQNEALEVKSNLNASQAQAYKDLFNITTDQKEILEALNKKIKRKALKDKFLFFGGGLSLGGLAFAILTR